MNNMEEEKKVRLCPDCGKEMRKGYLQTFGSVGFGEKRIRFAAALENPELYIHVSEGSLVTNECCFDGWICQDCGMILFDYTDPRAGMGKSLLDRMADGIDNAFDALDKRFGGWTTEEESTLTWEKPEAAAPASSEPEVTAAEEKPKKRIITSSGVQMVDERENFSDEEKR